MSIGRPAGGNDQVRRLFVAQLGVRITYLSPEATAAAGAERVGCNAMQEREVKKNLRDILPPGVTSSNLPGLSVFVQQNANLSSAVLSSFCLR